MGMSLSLGLSLSTAGGGGAGGAETHVFALLGQSNMVGNVTNDGGAQYPSGTLQVARGGSFSGGAEGDLVPAVNMLDHMSGTSTFISGIATQFAIDYKAANPNATIVFVPGANGGTGFSNNHWNPGNATLENFISRLNTLMAANPSFIFRGVLWHQGEADGAGGYSLAWDAMRAHMIASCPSINETTPFVVGSPFNAVSTASIAQSNFPDSVPYSAFAPSTGTTDAGDGIHFDAASLRLMGGRYATQYPNAVANSSVVTSNLIAFGTPIASGAGNTITAITDGHAFFANSAGRMIWGPYPNVLLNQIRYRIRFTAEADDVVNLPDVQIAANGSFSTAILLNQSLALTANTPAAFDFGFTSNANNQTNTYIGFRYATVAAPKPTLRITNLRIDRY